jgi:hypothetical protein
MLLLNSLRKMLRRGTAHHRNRRLAQIIHRGMGWLVSVCV